MVPLENSVDTEYSIAINELSEETPIGWSSTCLDQAINYYIDWNSAYFDNQKYMEDTNNF